MEENQHISNLFQRIRLKIGKQLLDRVNVVKIIQSETNITLSEDKIVYKNRIISLNVSPLIRGEIYIKKNNILKKIREETGLDIKDIK